MKDYFHILNQKIFIDYNNLAVISISVYDRINKLKACIESIKMNPLSNSSYLYIFSDAAKTGDEEKVSLIREYILTISGFKGVIPIFQKTNSYKKNLKDAREIPLLENERMIRLEDDIIVSPFFLEFMNISLEYFKHDKDILGVSGYSPPINKEKIAPSTIYLSKLWSGWSYGVWRDKNFQKFVGTKKPFSDMVKGGFVKKVAKTHPRLHKALKKMDSGNFFAGDQLLSYFLIKNDLYQVKPRYSLVQNIGFDGSGVNCGYSSMFDQQPYSDSFPVIINKVYAKEIDRRQFDYFYYKNNFFIRIYKNLLWAIQDFFDKIRTNLIN